MPSVIGNPGGNVATVEVVVVNEDGDPVADELVRLIESGTASPSRPEGRTADDGRLIFHEGTGPPPCNTFHIKLPERGEQRQRAGCFNNGDETSVQFTVPVDEQPVTPPGGPDPDPDQDELTTGQRTALVSVIGLAVGVGAVALRRSEF